MNTPSNIKLDYLESQVILSKSEQKVGSENKWLLLAHLESACSLICGSHEIFGKGGGDTLALL